MGAGSGEDSHRQQRVEAPLTVLESSGVGCGVDPVMSFLWPCLVPRMVEITVAADAHVSGEDGRSAS